jgi:hypothetical protein
MRSMRHRLRWACHILAALLVFSLGVPAWSQGDDLGDLLAGRDVPLTLKLKDLDRTWRKVLIGPPSDLPALSALLGAAGAPMANVGTYYTRGRTVRAGSETYLVAYSVEAPPDAPMGDDAEAPEPRLTADTELVLSLLNLRTAGHIRSIRPFNLEQELAATAEAAVADARKESLNRLKQVSIALMMYLQDYDERFPPMKEAITGKKVLLPYIKNEIPFIQPETGEPYGVNHTLSYHTLAEIEDPANLVTFFETGPDMDGMRAVAFLDGHVKRHTEAQWPELIKVSTLPIKTPPKPKPAVPPKTLKKPTAPSKPPTRSPTRRR